MLVYPFFCFRSKKYTSRTMCNFLKFPLLKVPSASTKGNLQIGFQCTMNYLTIHLRIIPYRMRRMILIKTFSFILTTIITSCHAREFRTRSTPNFNDAVAFTSLLPSNKNRLEPDYIEPVGVRIR